MASLLPYFVYLMALSLLVDRVRLELSLAGATGFWVVAAATLVVVRNQR
jgi:membrane protein GlpM